MSCDALCLNSPHCSTGPRERGRLLKHSNNTKNVPTLQYNLHEDTAAMKGELAKFEMATCIHNSTSSQLASKNTIQASRNAEQRKPGCFTSVDVFDSLTS